MVDDISMVPIEELHFSKQTDSLPAEFIDRIVLIHHAFRDYLAATLDETINNFTFDKHPEEEIKLWERMGSVIIYLRHSDNWPVEKMASAVKVVLGLSMESIQDNDLSDEETSRIIELWNERKTS